MFYSANGSTYFAAPPQGPSDPTGQSFAEKQGGTDVLHGPANDGNEWAVYTLIDTGLDTTSSVIRVNGSPGSLGRLGGTGG
ncbi:hypothetical protein, partial [Escherichia coli]|uniref:hypothetical protein n=1 Tax=Escherichia coli TaxID=562 RepID=UPI001BDC1EA8